MTTKTALLAAIKADIHKNPDDDHLEILARHVDVSAIERARAIDWRGMAELAELGYPAPDEDDIS